MKRGLNTLSLAMAAALYATATAPVLANEDAGESQDNTRLKTVVVTAEKTSKPLTVVTDPKAPRQPLPAHDGADYLKAIPGFSVIRKGGTDGDPVFRGMAGSRLNILLDGEMLFGGCGSRMDPPTAYVFPESYDSISIIKGPQTVRNGPGNSAGTILFERQLQRLPETSFNAHISTLVGSFDRNDEMVDVLAGTPDFYIRGTATNAHQGDYRDGDGKKVHSQYQRWSANAAAGWTPDENTTLELSMGHSDGEAAYADRGVDGSLFKRDNLGIKLIKENLTERWKKLEVQAYYNYVDHVMDNYSLRTPTGMMATRMAMNPDRETLGARLANTVLLGERTELVFGSDTQQNQHSNRTTMNQDMMRFQDKDRVEDANIEQVGVFGEITHHYNDKQRIISGLRHDHWHAEDKRQTVMLNMMMSAPNPTAGDERVEELTSGFMRYEHDIADDTAYVGLGRSERFPDYWELISKETADSVSAFNADPEETTQLDLGYLFARGQWTGSVSAFYNHIDDYLLIQSGVVKPMGMMGRRTTTITRNIEAHSWGGEAELGYAINDNWRVDASLAYVRGENDTDDKSLAQLPPLEARFGLHYDDGTWSYGALWRAVAKQTHVSVNQGNIAGQDIGNTRGFGVLSLNAGWKVMPNLQLTTGIDNLLDKTYAEHISRRGDMVAGFDQLDRVNEPGRTVWLKAQFDFD
ncbi:MAG: TonB-dependent copper receptor [Cellvibrionales bacterium]|nr:TonB-dependent copper receptor [Cellvibrionales bacterium]HNN86714.1 TonB-dependent copper receptor [Pseudomonadales bacterium]